MKKISTLYWYTIRIIYIIAALFSIYGNWKMNDESGANKSELIFPVIVGIYWTFDHSRLVITRILGKKSYYKMMFLRYINLVAMSIGTISLVVVSFENDNMPIWAGGLLLVYALSELDFILFAKKRRMKEEQAINQNLINNFGED